MSTEKQREAKAILRDLWKQFDKLAKTPVDTENPRGINVSRMHFDQWAHALSKAITKI